MVRETRVKRDDDRSRQRSNLYSVGTQSFAIKTNTRMDQRLRVARELLEELNTMGPRFKETKSLLEEVSSTMKLKSKLDWDSAWEALETANVGNVAELKNMMTNLAQGKSYTTTKAIFISNDVHINPKKKTKMSYMTHEVGEPEEEEDMLEGYETATWDEEETDEKATTVTGLTDKAIEEGSGVTTDEEGPRKATVKEVHEAIQKMEDEARSVYGLPIHRTLFGWHGEKLWYDPLKHEELYQLHYDFWMRRRRAFYEELFDDPLRYKAEEKGTRRKARYTAIEDRTKFLSRCLEIWGPDRLDQLIKKSGTTLFWWGGYTDQSKKKKSEQQRCPAACKKIRPLTDYTVEELKTRTNYLHLKKPGVRDEVLDQNIWDLLSRLEAVSPLTAKDKRFSDFALMRVSIDMIGAIERDQVVNEGYIFELDDHRDYDVPAMKIQATLQAKKELKLPPFEGVKTTAPKIRESCSDCDSVFFGDKSVKAIKKEREERERARRRVSSQTPKQSSTLSITPVQTSTLSRAASKKKLGTAEKERANALSKKRVIQELDFEEGVELLHQHNDRVDEAKRPKRTARVRGQSLEEKDEKNTSTKGTDSIVVYEGPNAVSYEQELREEGEVADDETESNTHIEGIDPRMTYRELREHLQDDEDIESETSQPPKIG